MLRRVSSRELTEWMAFYELRTAQAPAAEPVLEDSPAAQAARLKAALFKEK
jgi:hypothetical protein